MSDTVAQDKALAALRRPGSLLVLPTETLYGFSARAGDADSVARVTQLKGREHSGFVAVAAGFEQVAAHASDRTHPMVLSWLRRVWPAPLSVILPVNGPIVWGRGSVDCGWTAAFRVPPHKWLRRLAERLGEPILSTSVNRTGSPPLQQANDIVVQFGDSVDLVIVDATLEAPGVARVPSTLVDATQWPPQQLRAGAYAFEVPGETQE